MLIKTAFIYFTEKKIIINVGNSFFFQDLLMKKEKLKIQQRKKNKTKH